MHDPTGRIVMWIGSNTDITDLVQARETIVERRKELERLVNERTAKLQEAVEQMEEFSYSVSHDLRAPLRSMSGYARILLDDYADKLDEDGRDYLRRIENAGARMDRLTQDILTYSRISRTAVQLEPVPLQTLISEIIEQHRHDHPDATYLIDGPLPIVLGNEALLTQVVSNLMSNATKFVAPGVLPRIRIRAETIDGSARLWFEDNGIGIAPGNQSRIWGVFERLHPKGSYAGTGIGLAIVRKAVEKMKGAAGLESDGTCGCRFWIQLSRASSPPHEPTRAHRTSVIVFSQNQLPPCDAEPHA
jgi:signal transduction histidine kinase